MLDKILKVLMYATVFLMPVFFLPFTFEVLEFNKLYLLFFLVWLSVLVWFLKTIVEDKEVKIRYSIVDYAVLAFMGIAIVSSIFSVDKISSIFGYYGRFSTGLIPLLTFGAFYFLVVNNLGNAKRKTQNAKQQPKTQKADSRESGEGAITVGGVIKTLLCSGTVAMLFAYFSLFGLWAKLAGINNQLSLIINKMALRVSPVGGTAQALSMFLTVMVILAVFVILGGWKKGGFSHKGWKIFAGIFIFFAFVLLIVTDFTPAWIVLSLALISLVILALRKKILKNEVHRLILPIALIILSVLFLMLNFRTLAADSIRNNANVYFNFMPERILTQGESWEIAGNTVISGFKTGLIGSGPGTFYYDFSKFKPDQLNQGDLWAIRFDRAGNMVSEVLATMGILGLLALLGILITFFWIPFPALFKRTRRAKARAKSKLDYGFSVLLIIFAALMLIQFSYYQTLTLAFLFWLFLGLGIGWQGLKREEQEQDFVKVKRFRLKDFVEIALATETILIVLFLGFVVVCFFGSKFYMADVKYVEALNEPGLDDKVANLQEAIKLNPRQARYQMVLSKVFLAKAQEGLIALREGENQQEVVQNIGLARLFAMNATQITPQQIATWQALADFYQNTMVMASESEQFASLTIDALNKAVELEPKNPQLYTEIGNMYLLLGQQSEAKTEFEKAVEQKLNYVPANIRLAVMLEDEGKIDEAIAKLEWLLATAPNSPEVLFQLGRIYYNQGDTDRAISQFLAALTINPNYSNALYSLGIAYEKQGRNKEALMALEGVLSLNPDVQEIRDRIERLKAGISEPGEEIEGEIE
jgi:tetratricopeptide (TPR) repeat protein